jgi:modulator of FtsH protease HflK
LLIIVALAIWAATGFYLVDQSERGVVLRFGKFRRWSARACTGTRR